MCWGGGGARLVLAEGMVTGEGAITVVAGRTVAVAFMCQISPLRRRAAAATYVLAWL
jgi:hypothetical protein